MIFEDAFLYRRTSRSIADEKETIFWDYLSEYLNQQQLNELQAIHDEWMDALSEADDADDDVDNTLQIHHI